MKPCRVSSSGLDIIENYPVAGGVLPTSAVSVRVIPLRFVLA